MSVFGGNRDIEVTIFSGASFGTATEDANFGQVKVPLGPVDNGSRLGCIKTNASARFHWIHLEGYMRRFSWR
jgi:hypothetical protein